MNLVFRWNTETVLSRYCSRCQRCENRKWETTCESGLRSESVDCVILLGTLPNFCTGSPVLWSTNSRNYSMPFLFEKVLMVLQPWTSKPSKMKVLPYIPYLFFLAIVLPSCGDSCSHCMVKDDNDNVIKDYDEKCGTSEDVDEYERSAEEDAAQYSGSFSCDNWTCAAFVLPTDRVRIPLRHGWDRQGS